MLRGLGIAALIGLGAGLTLWGADTYLGRHESPPGTPETALDSLNARYAPFSVQHPHPFYGFFFPLGPGERAALSNETITLTPEGFRGAGPEAREGRKLAFLVGGSVAFGFSSSDSTTITGYLNRLQDEYHFVGAGVPSWNTSQSMLRTVVELLPYEPALVVLWGGYNDAAQAHTWAQRGQPFPAGTYESFDAVHGLYAGDLRRAPDLSLFEQWFPRLAKRLRPASPALPFGPAGDAAAARFRDNMRVTAAAARGAGAQFLGVFQPILPLHRHAPPDVDLLGRPEFDAFLAAFHERATSPPPDSSFIDLGRMFDAAFKPVPLHRPGDGLDEAIFVDLVHVYEAGNQIIAEAILDAMGG